MGLHGGPRRRRHQSLIFTIRGTVSHPLRLVFWASRRKGKMLAGPSIAEQTEEPVPVWGVGKATPECRSSAKPHSSGMTRGTDIFRTSAALPAVTPPCRLED